MIFPLSSVATTESVVRPCWKKHSATVWLRKPDNKITRVAAEDKFGKHRNRTLVRVLKTAWHCCNFCLNRMINVATDFGWSNAHSVKTDTVMDVSEGSRRSVERLGKGAGLWCCGGAGGACADAGIAPTITS